MKKTFALTIAAVMFAGIGCLQDEQPEDESKDQLTRPVEATVDTVGTKGKGERTGYLSRVVAERFRAEYKIQLDVAMYNVQLYKATEGRLPKDMDEFTKELIENPNYAVQLPELPEGQHYEYDPNDGPTGKLWVVPDGQTLDPSGN